MVFERRAMATSKGCSGRSHLRRIVVAVAMLMVCSAPVQAAFKLIHQGDNSHLVVFVHGLWGDPHLTFKSPKAALTWPQMLASDKIAVRGMVPTKYSYGTLGYPDGGALDIQEVIDKLREELVRSEAYSTHASMSFVGHSLGGIVVKDLVMGLSTKKMIEGVLLVSVPSEGANIADYIKVLPEVITGRLVVDLARGTTILRSINTKWHEFFEDRKNGLPAVGCAVEKVATNGVMVVPPEAMTTDCDGSRYPIVENHIDIVKPLSISSDVYVWMKGRMAEIEAKKK
jgi:pimeloyl-ACP methyl ester carboxylesterase